MGGDEVGVAALDEVEAGRIQALGRGDLAGDFELARRGLDEGEVQLGAGQSQAELQHAGARPDGQDPPSAGAADGLEQEGARRGGDRAVRRQVEVEIRLRVGEVRGQIGRRGGRGIGGHGVSGEPGWCQRS